MTPITQHNGFKVVRTNCEKATPFLRSTSRWLRKAVPPPARALDLGCGNGRNSKFLIDMDYSVSSYDRFPDYGRELDLEVQTLPHSDGSVDLILCQYVLMFLDAAGRQHLIEEMTRVAACPCVAVVEVAAVKNCLTPSKQQAVGLCQEVAESMISLGWFFHRQAPLRFVACRAILTSA